MTDTGQGAVTLEIISEIAELKQLQNEWDVFARGLSETTPFQLPLWLVTWWQHFGSGQLRVMMFRKETALAGIVPCFVHEWNGRRQMTLIGSGISDYLEPAIIPEVAPEVVACLHKHLVSNPDWSVCDWQDLSCGTPFAGLNGNGLRATLRPDMPCTEILIDRPFESYWEERPHGLRRNVRRYGEKAKQIAEPEFVVTCAAEEPLLDALIRLHKARWQRHGESGMVEANRSGEFLRQVARDFARQKMLRLFSIRFQGETVAVILSIAYNNVLFSYLSAFDPELEALGFGRTLLHQSLRHAFESGYRAWNFLRGTEPYKAEWGAQAINKQRLLIERECDASC